MTKIPSDANRHRLGDIVSRLGGELIGDANIVIRRLATLQNASPGDIAFLTHGKYRKHLGATRASAVILAPDERNSTSIARIVSRDPYLYFARVARLLSPDSPPVPGIHPSAVIDKTAAIPASAAIGPGCHVGKGVKLGERVALGACCCVGDGAEIGDDSLLHASVIIYRDCIVGKRAIVHSGAVIGSDGFGMALDEGHWLKIPQTGRVVIGDDVEIGANTTIDRGALDDTIIEDGVKLDNQIQVGHNVHIGAHTAIAGCVGIAGSARIGRHCTIGGAAGILGHLEIADRVNISAKTLVTRSIRQPGTYTGAFPLAPNKEWVKIAAHLRNLDGLAERVKELENQLASATRKKR